MSLHDAHRFSSGSSYGSATMEVKSFRAVHRGHLMALAFVVVVVVVAFVAVVGSLITTIAGHHTPGTMHQPPVTRQQAPSTRHSHTARGTRRQAPETGVYNTRVV